jgi:hypothetical protein
MHTATPTRSAWPRAAALLAPAILGLIAPAVAQAGCHGRRSVSTEAPRAAAMLVDLGLIGGSLDPASSGEDAGPPCTGAFCSGSPAVPPPIVPPILVDGSWAVLIGRIGRREADSRPVVPEESRLLPARRALSIFHPPRSGESA